MAKTKKSKAPKLEADLVQSIILNEEHRLRIRPGGNGFSEEELSAINETIGKCSSVEEAIAAMEQFA